MTAIAVVALLILASQAQAKPIYVDTASRGGACSDSRGAGAAAKPKTPLCSIERALQVAPAGGRIVVRGGSYPPLRVEGFSRGATVSVQAVAGEGVSVASVRIADADHLRLQGLKVTAGFSVVGTDHDIEIVGNEIGDQRSGLFIYGEGGGSTNIAIIGNSIHDIDYPEANSTGPADGYGIQMIGRVSNVRIAGNTIRSVVEDYIQGGGDNLTVDHNTFLGPSRRHGHSEQVHSDLWQIFGSSSHVVFSNNVARDTGTQNGLLFQFSGPDRPHEDVRIVNNVFDNASDGTEMQIYNTNGLLIANNTAIGSKDGTLLRNDDQIAPGSGYRIVNNIFQSDQNTSLSIDRNWGVEDHNIIVHPGNNGRRGWGRHDIVGRWPRLVDVRAGHLRYATARSVGVDDGTPDGAPSRDVTGGRRDAKPDIGAYEYRGPKGGGG